MADAPKISDSSPGSAPARISYILLVIFALTVAAVFGLIFCHVTIDAVVAGILGTILGSEGGALTAITGFWLANSLQSNRTNATKDAALAQIAGSGPPPPAPAEPVAGAPA